MRTIIKRILTKAAVVTFSTIIAVGFYRDNCSTDKEPLPNCDSQAITFETEDSVFSVNVNTGTNDFVSDESQSNTESSQNDVFKESQTENVSELATNAPDTDYKEADDIIPLPVSMNNEEINSEIENAEEQIIIREASDIGDTESAQYEFEYTISITESNEPANKNEFYLIDVPFISQLTGYPTGCEAVSTAMVLNYYGYEISPDEIIDEHLIISPLPTKQNEVLQAESPWNAFIGDPYSNDGYGCYSIVIENALYNIIDDGVNYIVRSENSTLDELCQNYVANDIPIIVWATAEMRSGYVSEYWIAPDGETVSWIAPEHCLVLTGFDDEYYYFNDPRCGKNTPYRKASAESAFKSMYCQSIVIARW